MSQSARVGGDRVPAHPTPRRGGPSGRRPRWRLPGALRTLGALAGLAAAALFVQWSLAFVRDREAPGRLVAGFLDLIGLDSAAATMRSRGLGPIPSKLMIAVVALLVGVAGVWLLFIAANGIVQRLRYRARERVTPWLFVGPAIILVGVFLVYPMVSTVYTSFTEDIADFPGRADAAAAAQPNTLEVMAAGEERVRFDGYLLNWGGFELGKVTILSSRAAGADRPALLLLMGSTVRTLGLQNYAFAATDPDMRIALRNNVLWLVFGTGGSVVIGLMIAALVDRVKREALAKTFIFLPMAISFVGASVIWRFVYAWRPPGEPQTGLLNAIWTAFGADPVSWLQTPPLNTFALINIMIWLQTGFAMVVLSAALKAVPDELIEAARIDGANERQLFFRVVLPSIRGSVITVATAIFIGILKVFDIVLITTGGKFDTEVIANRMFAEMFKFRNFGRAAALAVVLLAVVVPIMVVNIRNLHRQGVGG